jgi:hypothetical protein
MKYCLAIFLLLISFNSHAALHKWVDEEGKVHYSDTAAPPSVKSQTLRQSAPAEANSSSTAAAPKSLADLEAEQRRAEKEKSDAAQKAAKEQEQAAIRKKSCDDARNYLSGLENSPRVVTYDAQGERSYLDDNERQQRIEETRKTISNNCQ